MMAELLVYNKSRGSIVGNFAEICYGTCSLKHCDEMSFLDEGKHTFWFPQKEITVIKNISEQLKAMYINAIATNPDLVVMPEYLEKCIKCKWFDMRISTDARFEEIKEHSNYRCHKIMNTTFEQSSPCGYASPICDLGMVPEVEELDRFELMDFDE